MRFSGSGVIRGVSRRVKSGLSEQNRTIAYDFTHVEYCNVVLQLLMMIVDEEERNNDIVHRVCWWRAV